MSQFNGELKERLVRYCAIDSQSDIDSPTAPSTECQHEMLDLMVAELTEIGASDVTKTSYGTVLATIPGNSDGPTVGFLAHVDTAPQFNATGVKPRVIEGYNGGDITYPDNPDLILSPADFPYLAQKVGDDIIAASGLTLLGADDKSGIAVIMTAMRHLLENPEIKHPTIRVAFTPDEEIGRGWMRSCRPIWAWILPIRSTVVIWVRSCTRRSRPTLPSSRSKVCRSTQAPPRTSW